MQDAKACSIALMKITKSTNTEASAQIWIRNWAQILHLFLPSPYFRFLSVTPLFHYLSLSLVPFLSALPVSSSSPWSPLSLPGGPKHNGSVRALG